MDLRAYYKKVREAEATLTDDHIVVVSFTTPEGGREGVRTEAPRSIAARIIAEGRGRAATAEESVEFREAMREARERHQQEEAARRVQVMVIPANEVSRTPKIESRPKDRS